ncbi:glycosyl transferase family 2 [Desulfonema ishimotonii]|uniref:Glycosyl transferase family 2 n=1 Tax=Desulfonema ishimotonii TaxID=45657 RepID=A0A401FVD8_9BACT|nr:glycosyltransferase family 2 protein [Desulfonema ishimotonii]GBC60930.1 glycosyl transferase family 2 [Desulfonema ishimotonii]
MTNPLISIVVTCHNRRHYLGQTMAAIFAQKYRPVEIVVVDDGSTDKTHELMKGYGDKIRYYWQENRGVAVTRTHGARLARGEYIAFQDDDDLMPPDRIVNLYAALQKHPGAVFATGDYASIDADGNLTGDRWLWASPEREGASVLIEDGYAALLWNKIPIAPHTTLFRKSDGERVGWFDPLFIYASSDKDFFLRLAQLGSVVHVRKIVSYYRRGHAQIWSNDLLGNYSRLMLYEKHFSTVDSSRKDLRKRIRFHLLHALRRIAWCKSRGICNDVPALEAYIHRGVSLLNMKERIAYRWYALIRMPIRRLIKGCDKETGRSLARS